MEVPNRQSPRRHLSLISSDTSSISFPTSWVVVVMIIVTDGGGCHDDRFLNWGFGLRSDLFPPRPLPRPPSPYPKSSFWSKLVLYFASVGFWVWCFLWKLYLQIQKIRQIMASTKQTRTTAFIRCAMDSIVVRRVLRESPGLSRPKFLSHSPCSRENWGLIIDDNMWYSAWHLPQRQLPYSGFLWWSRHQYPRSLPSWTGGILTKPSPVVP